MAKENEVVLQIVVDNEEAIDKIIKQREKLAELRNEQENLKKSYADNSISEKEFAQQMEATNVAINMTKKSIRDYSKEVEDNTNKRKTNMGSLSQMRLELKNLIKEYDNLSAADREAGKGKELIKNIGELDKKVKEAEASTGRFKSNVGNYPQVFSVAGVEVGKMSGIMSGVAPAAASAMGGITRFGKALLSLAANPIVLLITGIVAVLKKLVDTFKENDTAMTTLQAALAKLQPVITMFKSILNGIVEVIAKIIEGYMTIYSTIIGYIVPGFKEASEAAEENVRALDKLEDRQRAFTVASAKREKENAELLRKTTEKSKYSVKERLEALDKMSENEQKELEEKKAIAAEELRIYEQKLKQEGKEYDDLADDKKDKLAQLQADLIKVETEYNTSMASIAKRRERFLAEEEREENERAKKILETARKAAEERKKIKESEYKAHNDLDKLIVQSMKDGLDKSLREAELNTKLQINEKKKQLKEDKSLSKQAKEDINEQIKLLERILQEDLIAIRNQYNEQEINNQYNRIKDYYSRKLALANGEHDKEFEILRDSMIAEQQYYMSQADFRNMSAEQQKAVTELFEQQINQLKITYAQKTQQEVNELEEAEWELQYQKKIAAANNNAELMAELEREMYQHKLERAKEYYDSLASMDEETYNAMGYNTNTWNKAVTDAQNDVIKQDIEMQKFDLKSVEVKEKAVTDSQKLMVQSSMDALGSTVSFFQMLAKKDEAFADVATGFALVQIFTNMGIAIASAIAGATGAASTPPTPATPAMMAVYIATMVGAVTSGIASAIETIDQAKAAKQSASASVSTLNAQYATGGYVQGAGTGTSDSIHARLSNGESVINARSTSKYYDLLSAINVAGGGVAFRNSTPAQRRFSVGGVAIATQQKSYENLISRQDLIDVISDIQPVVSVKEITRLQNRVQIKEKLAKI